MNMKQLTMAAAVSTAIGGVGITQANIGGVPGEGLLVPYVDKYTFVQLLTPGAVGIDTVINTFTAPNTTPGLFPAPAGQGVHWFLFDHESKHVCDGIFPMTDDDVISINIGALGNGIGKDGNILYGEGCFDVDYGYAVFVDEESVDGSGATRPMFGDAQWHYHDEYIEIPVVPVADGPDNGNIEVRSDEVLFNVVAPLSGRIAQVSPVAAGIRFDDDTGAAEVNTVIDQVFDVGGYGEDSHSSTLHFFWFDQNAARAAQVDTVDENENTLSCKNQPLPFEMNIVVVEDNAYGLADTKTWGIRNDAVDGPKTICGNYDSGFFKYAIAEYNDADDDGFVDSAGYAWAVQLMHHRNLKSEVEVMYSGYTESWNTEAKLVGKF